MAESLFRAEVYAARVVPGLGAVGIGTPRYSGRFTLLLLISTFAAAAYLCTVSHARSVSASGFLIPQEGTVKLASQDSGAVILAVHVEEGDFVRSGDALLTLGVPVALESGAEAAGYQPFSERLLQGFEAQLDQLQQEDRTLTERHRLGRMRMLIELERLETRQKELAAARALRIERLAMVGSKSRALEGLRSRRVISDLDWMDHQSLVLQLQEELLSLDAQMNSAISEREAGRLQLAEIDAVHTVEKLRNAGRRSALKMEQDRAAVASTRVLLATRSGYIDALEAQPGMIANQGSPLLRIVSRSTPLHARLLIPGRAAGFVSVGQTVHLRFDAFPHQHFGTQPAQLVSLSSGISTAGETPGAFRPAEPVYVGDARLQSQVVATPDGPAALREGMRFSADLELEQRTLIQWLLEPLLSLGNPGV